MDGNHSFLDIESHLMHCADIQLPFVINIVLGLPANICVMWLILAGPRDKAAELCSLNQAVCEVVTCSLSAVLLIVMNMRLSDVGIFTFLYYNVQFSWVLMLLGRPLFMTCVSLERYLAVVHPVTFLKYKPLKYRLAGTIICWLMLVVFAMIIIWVPYPDAHYVMVGMVFTFFVLQLIFCVGTLCALVKPGPGDGNQRSHGMNGAKLHAFRIIVIIFVATALSYQPFIFSIVLFGHISTEDSSKLFCTAAYTALVSGFIPPLLYIHRAGILQRCIKDISNA